MGANQCIYPRVYNIEGKLQHVLQSNVPVYTKWTLPRWEQGVFTSVTWIIRYLLSVYRVNGLVVFPRWGTNIRWNKRSSSSHNHLRNHGYVLIPPYCCSSGLLKPAWEPDSSSEEPAYLPSKMRGQLNSYFNFKLLCVISVSGAVYPTHPSIHASITTTHSRSWSSCAVSEANASSHDSFTHTYGVKFLKQPA